MVTIRNVMRVGVVFMWARAERWGQGKVIRGNAHRLGSLVERDGRVDELERKEDKKIGIVIDGKLYKARNPDHHWHGRHELLQEEHELAFGLARELIAPVQLKQRLRLCE